MSRYTINYQTNYDIDWFFTDGNRYFHVASNGGAIPDFIKVDRDSNVELQNAIASMEIITLDISVIENPNNLNYSSFIDFAKKGFVSIDKINDAFDSQNYIVIAQPNSNNLKPNIDVSKIPLLDKKFRDQIHVIGLDDEPLW